CLFLFDYFDSRTVILVRLLRFWDYQNTDRGYTVYFDSRTAKSYVHNSSSLHMTASFFSLLDSFHFCPLGYKDFPDFGNTTSSLLSTCCHVVLELWYNWSWVKATWSLEVIFPDGIFPADGKSEIEGKNKYFELFQFNKRGAASMEVVHGRRRATARVRTRKNCSARWSQGKGSLCRAGRPWGSQRGRRSGGRWRHWLEEHGVTPWERGMAQLHGLSLSLIPSLWNIFVLLALRFLHSSISPRRRYCRYAVFQFWFALPWRLLSHFFARGPAFLGCILFQW
ncbi:hypothetical protein ACJX0J_033494, partial [Zea mays]